MSPSRSSRDAAVSRREARKSALTLLYQWDVTERAPGELYEGEIDEYAQTVTTAVVRDAAELDRRITEAAAESGWTADRLGAVERNILRIAIHELDVGEIPPAAVIDEAVTLAKQYSTREAGRLVNGILDRINKEAAHEHRRILSQGGGAARAARGGARRARPARASRRAARPTARSRSSSELSELAKAVEEELERAKRSAEADAQKP